VLNGQLLTINACQDCVRTHLQSRAECPDHPWACGAHLRSLLVAQSRRAVCVAQQMIPQPLPETRLHFCSSQLNIKVSKPCVQDILAKCHPENFKCWVMIIYQLLTLYYSLCSCHVVMFNFVSKRQRYLRCTSVIKTHQNLSMPNVLTLYPFQVRNTAVTKYNMKLFSTIHHLKYEGATLQSLTQLSVFCARIFQKIKEMKSGWRWESPYSQVNTMLWNLEPETELKIWINSIYKSEE